MPKIQYVHKKFSSLNQAIIDQANQIFTEYEAQGFILTLRQLYYQFISRGLLPNTVQSYKRLGGIISDGRLDGQIDWELMEDRTRNLKQLSSWRNPESVVSACADQFRIDKWRNQEHRPEVWIEKDALSGVFERICNQLQVPYFSCRGYTSQSEMWVAGQRLQRWIDSGQIPVVFHFGDHDPSGIDMTRDIVDRLQLFMGGVRLERLALNMDQVHEYNPPPNPAKISDTRAAGYIAAFGDESWELDALDPGVLTALVENAVSSVRDEDHWEESVAQENEYIRQLRSVVAKWDSIIEGLNSEENEDA